MTHVNKLALIGLSILTLPTLGRANLIVQGGFESDNIIPLSVAVGPPFVSGVWGVEVAARDMGPTGGVSPFQGDWMLRMQDDGLSTTQALQFVDLSSRGSLDTLDVGAWYNSDATAAQARLNLWYFATANSWGTTLSIDAAFMTLDNSAATWENISNLSTIPTAANWVGVEIAFSNATIGNNSGFVDEVSMALVPEPVSMITLGIGLAALVVRRRRRK